MAMNKWQDCVEEIKEGFTNLKTLKDYDMLSERGIGEYNAFKQVLNIIAKYE